MTLPLITTTAAPSSIEVADLATIRTELGLDTSKDARLRRFIRAVSLAFAGAEGLRRDLWRAGFTEQLTGPGGELMPLSRWPIESVSEVREGGTALDPADYSIAAPELSELYRLAGWIHTTADGTVNLTPGHGGKALDVYAVDYIAGWLMPGEVSDWAPATAYALGDMVRRTSAVPGLLFECTTAGTSHASTEPTWPAAAGDTVADESPLVWTARTRFELPFDLAEAAIAQVLEWYGGGMEIPTGIKSEAFESMRVEYADQGHAGGLYALSTGVRAVLRHYR